MKHGLKRCFLLNGIFIASIATGCVYKPPGKSYRGPLPELTPVQVRIRNALRRDVYDLAGKIGPRAVTRLVKAESGVELRKDPRGLQAAARWAERRLREAGYDVRRQDYAVDGVTCTNFSAELRGARRPGEIVVVGAHYDSVAWSPGANDNAGGVAVVLALARALRDQTPDRTLRFVLFTNEELPHAGTDAMGSRRYARGCHERGERIVAMLSLDELGYFKDERGSQHYPFPLNLWYPSTGNFLAFVSNGEHRRLMFRTVRLFREHARFPSEGLAMNIRDVGRSDHASFWEYGYPALLVTCTGNFRNPYYHAAGDTPERVDYDRLARVVTAFEHVLMRLADDGEQAKNSPRAAPAKLAKESGVP